MKIFLKNLATGLTFLIGLPSLLSVFSGVILMIDIVFLGGNFDEVNTASLLLFGGIVGCIISQILDKLSK